MHETGIYLSSRSNLYKALLLSEITVIFLGLAVATELDGILQILGIINAVIWTFWLAGTAIMYYDWRKSGRYNHPLAR